MKRAMSRLQMKKIEKEKHKDEFRTLNISILQLTDTLI